MPPLPRGYQPVPFAGGPRYVPQYGTLGELMGLQARNTQQGWAQLAGAFDRFVQTKRQQEAAQLERQDLIAQRKAAEQLKRDEMEARKAERDEAERLRKEAAQEKTQLAAEKRGDARAKAIGYGPIAEADVDTVMQSPERAGDVRYSFGPGTVEGPELQPTRDQQEMIALKEAVTKQGGLVGPNGAVHMPPKPAGAKSLQRETALVNGRPMFVNFNPETGTYTDQQGNPVTPTPIPQREPTGQGALTGRIVTIGNNFKSEPVVKTAQTMAQTMSFLQGLDPNTNNPADDQALIYAFAKAMDPDSVVREGEYATVQKYSQSLKDKFGFDIKRLFSNTPFLTPEARKSLKATVEARFEPLRKQYQGVFEEYARRINKISGKDDGAEWLTDYGVSFPAPTNAPKKNPNR